MALLAAVALTANTVFGATEQECTMYKGNHFIKIQPPYGEPNGCIWYIDTLLGEGWALYSYMPISDTSICKCDMAIMVR